MRLFIAIKLPKRIIEEISKLKKEIIEKTKVRAKFVEDENLHITLKFLGEVEKGKVENINKILASISLNFPKFKVKICNVGVFPSLSFIRVLWLGCESEKLVELIKKINEKLEIFGFEKEENVIPHLTIARVKEKNELLRKFIVENKNLTIGEFEVSSFYLIESKLTRKGPIYKEVAKFTLQ